MKITKLIFSIILLGLATLTLACKEEKKESVTPTEITFKKEGELTLYKAKTDSIIKVLDIEIADTGYDRETGLMYRSSMEENRGMLFVFPKEEPRAFYMKNTQIALDLIYIGKNQTVVSISKNAKPMDETSLLSYEPAMYVLEINAGLADLWQLKKGDSITYTK
ncbi:DUF192 domain-containing protein [Formosa algae]|uniref:Uncharacterized membrane protein (UPF0127 family) n=1 Tax=Formosa algae TaxID=225843 RepID=A0A9X0YM22_9FLAO|nr:DUF192 domain-containing protein [Formosa algae]MBP1839393.1 uncharacterized membrane protein (UPF0127 family) [Formosa algae]MDQ0334697.1 uncharacterized membrane protein (UPF0127 family) [Formosa algae]OEI81274.1 hypothetical protein AST99_04730 [Formosa algae]PNW27785.1 hypothetical protein BKP44_11415 [Formosa algae]